MESIWYMTMMPVRSTGHEETWLTDKHNNVEKEQKSCTIHSLESSEYCFNDPPGISQTLMTSVVSCTLPLSTVCYSRWSSAVICCKVVKNSFGPSEVLLIILGEPSITGVGSCSWKRLDRMTLVIPSMRKVPDIPSSWKKGRIPTKYCPHGPAQTLWQAVCTPGKKICTYEQQESV